VNSGRISRTDVPMGEGILQPQGESRKATIHYLWFCKSYTEDRQEISNLRSTQEVEKLGIKVVVPLVMTHSFCSAPDAATANIVKNI